MSELVQDHFFLNYQDQISHQEHAESPYKLILDGVISKIQRANLEGYNFKIKQSSNSSGSLVAFVHLKSQSLFSDLLVEIHLDLKHKKLQFICSLLKDQHFFIVQTSPKRRLICRKLIKINNEMELSGVKFIQNLQNGKINLVTCFEESEVIYGSKDLLWHRIKYHIKKIFETCQLHQLQLLQVLDKQKQKLIQLKVGGDEFKKLQKQQISFHSLLKQIEVSHIDFGFSSKADESSYSTLQKSKVQEQMLRKFMMEISNQKFEVSSRKLFITDFHQLLQISPNQSSYEVEHAQSALYCSYLKTPAMKDPSSTNVGENKFILNNIEILKPQTVRFRDSNHEGGKNKIQFGKISFFYCNSDQNTKSREKYERQSTIKNGLSPYKQLFKMNSQTPNLRVSNSILTKLVGLKVLKKKSGDKDKQQSQIYHNQARIINLFKGGCSPYILKYYISNQVNFQYRKCLLMDFLPNCQPLSNFIEILKQTFSLYSKVYILVNIANSLRFINDYNIVHMDINLNNILVFRDYITKLIDFGEAYSLKLRSSSGTLMKRGYTPPFCSPEYFQRKDNFIIQQDIFSLGMIIYRMIFSEYPFFPSNSLVSTYKEKTYGKKMLLAPERGEAFGNGQTVDLIYKTKLIDASPRG